MCYLFAKGANLLANFVKGFSQLRAEWACTALQLCIDDLHEEHHQAIWKGFNILHFASLHNEAVFKSIILTGLSRVLVPEDK